MGSDKEVVVAQHSLIDPLYEPDPSDETGLNSHFRSTFADMRPNHTGSSVETNPYRRARASSAATRSISTASHGGYHDAIPSSRNPYPSPPNSASPRKDQFSGNHRAEAFGSMKQAPSGRPRRSSQPTAYKPTQGDLARSGSLRQRYPGDATHRPLDMIRTEKKKADRAPHLRKKNFGGADVIDRLDGTTFSYHHEGPYDAANAARNFDYKHSPVAAVQDSNEEALRATPRENIQDALAKHRPLEGVANIPPGMPDMFGRVLNYEEGADLQREPGGDYRRWPGVEYLPGDLKGKGEPSYSIEKALKDHKTLGDSGTEMSTRHRNPESVSLQDPFNDDHAAGPSTTTGKSTGGGGHREGMGGALKKRFGSLRRK